MFSPEAFTRRNRQVSGHRPRLRTAGDGWIGLSWLQQEPANDWHGQAAGGIPRCLARSAPNPKAFLRTCRSVQLRRPPGFRGPMRVKGLGLFDKIKTGLHKTHQKLVHELKRIVTLSP